MMAEVNMECVVKEGVMIVNHVLVINYNIRKSWRLGSVWHKCRVVEMMVVAGVFRFS